MERTDLDFPAPNSKILFPDQEFTNGQHKKKRSKKHKDKERERLKPDWIETSPDLKQNQENLKGKFSANYRTVFDRFMSVLDYLFGH